MSNKTRKIAWPWTGSTQHEMGSMSPKGEVTDMDIHSQQPYDSLAPGKSLTDSQDGSEHQNGIISPVDNVSFARDPKRTFYKSNSDFQMESDSIWGKFTFVFDTEGWAQVISDEVEEIKLKPEAKILREGSRDWNKLIGKNRKKNNLTSYLEDIIQIALDEGYDFIHFNQDGGFGSPILNPEMVETGRGKSLNKSDKMEHVEVYDNDQIIASFSCDVAKTLQEKVIGLQSYNSLNKNAGLVFEYDKPEDVLYHMGTVSFAIDILFIDKENSIKKIYKNIQPGTLGTFGCAGVKKVLEICGGLSDRLGIKLGNKILLSKKTNTIDSFNKTSQAIGIEKNVIVKYSSLSKNKIFNWKGFPILCVNDNLNKTAAKNKFVSDLTSSFKIKSQKVICAFDFDGLIDLAPNLDIYKISNTQDENVNSYFDINGKLVKVSTDFKSVNLNKVLSENLNADETIVISSTKSFKEFLNSPKVISEAFKLFNEFKRASQTTKSIIVTRHSNIDLFKKILSGKMNLYFGEPINVDVLPIVPEADASDIIDHVRHKFGKKEVRIFSDNSLLKRAGSPIPNEIRQRAKKAYKFLSAAKELAETSLENMKTNVAEYDKIKDKPESIKATKGLYNQSVKNNTRIIRDMLMKIRESIRILNEIKDISTTEKIIDAITGSAKITSEAIEEIFDLIDQMELQEFHMVLSQKVQSYEKVIEDLNSSLDRGLDYINSEILGLMVLSD